MKQHMYNHQHRKMGHLVNACLIFFLLLHFRHLLRWRFYIVNHIFAMCDSRSRYLLYHEITLILNERSSQSLRICSSGIAKTCSEKKKHFRENSSSIIFNKMFWKLTAPHRKVKRIFGMRLNMFNRLNLILKKAFHLFCVLLGPRSVEH